MIADRFITLVVAALVVAMDDSVTTGIATVRYSYYHGYSNITYNITIALIPRQHLSSFGSSLTVCENSTEIKGLRWLE